MTDNQFVCNLGIQTRCHPTLPCEPANLILPHQLTAGRKSEHVQIPVDNTVSTFWITNPDNSNRDHVKDGDSLWVKLVVGNADNEGPIVEPAGRFAAQANIEISKGESKSEG